MVLGIRTISEFLSVKMPEFMPLMAVHDPPGGELRY